MSPMGACLALVVSVAGITAFAACSGSKPQASTPGHEAASASASAASSVPDPTDSPVSLVNATVVVGKCPDAKTMNNRAAQSTIHRLVDPCVAVPGGKAHFAATMLPGGRIELASPTGDPAEGVVPTCVLHHNLLHQVYLKKPCTFDVQLEERTNVPPSPADSSQPPGP